MFVEIKFYLFCFLYYFYHFYFIFLKGLIKKEISILEELVLMFFFCVVNQRVVFDLLL